MPDLEQKPIDGEVRSLQLFNDKRKRKYVWFVCSKCENGHWIDLYYYNKKFKNKLCISCSRSQRLQGKYNPSWNGGRHITTEGYVQVYLEKGHTYYSMTVKGRNYVLEHRLIIAKNIGRCLKPWEVVHHKNGDRQDNRLSNLELLSSKKDHIPSMVIQSYIRKLENRIKVLENR